VLLGLELIHEVIVVLLKRIAVPYLLALVRDPHRQDRVFLVDPKFCHGPAYSNNRVRADDPAPGAALGSEALLQ
jgi:hypothetical protein